MKLYCLALLVLPVLAFAQTSNVPASTGGNLISNGKFENFTSKDNLWDGVDSDGFLAGFTASTDVTLEGGKVGRMQMPTCVQVADLNGDGLLDLFTVDAAGYFHVYFNIGTKTEPRFNHAEIVPVFLHRLGLSGVTIVSLSTIPKACLVDFDRSGTMDLLIGNYLGQLMLIKNTGTRSAPEWHQPSSVESVSIPTTSDDRLWANLFAPAAYDWNHDGKMDVIVGEGSYSANAVHLLLNVGTSTVPKFTEESREYLAYGDGREQLVPAVVDYNGDGIPDLLVGDRMGNINVYLSEGPYKKDQELKRQKDPISFGGVTTIGTGPAGARPVHPTVADLNGDGLFDIIVGEANGRIAWAANIGTKTEPKFGPLVELKGEDVLKKDTIREPATWEIAFGERDGNINGYYSVVSPLEDPEAGPTSSNHVLKFGYFPSQNKIIRKPPLVMPGATKPTNGTSKTNDFTTLIAAGFKDYPNTVPFFWMIDIDRTAWTVDSNVALLRKKIDVGVLKPNTNYKLTFRVKGHGVKEGCLRFTLAGWLMRDTSKKDTEFNAKNLASEIVHQNEEFNVTPNWTVVTKQLNFKFQKEGDLNNPAKWGAGSRIEYKGVLEIHGTLGVDTGAFYIDDVELTPM